MRLSSVRRMRKLDGTTPPDDPECTPSVSTSTRSVMSTRPRSEVVTHSRSQSPHHESRATTSDGSPRRSPSRSRWAGRSGLPDSSLASMRTTQRACDAAGGPHGLEGRDGRERRVAVVGAAAPVEAVAVDDRLPRAEAGAPARERRLLVEVPVEQHGVVGGTVDRRGARRRCSSGVRPSMCCTSTLAPSRCSSTWRWHQSRSRSVACAMCPASSHVASYATETLGMRM